MDAIIAILRAAHCKSTHHYFAIDALHEVQSVRGKSLADLLLAHYGDYLKGAKDPDTVFKDFENHVLHVRDGYWGGAAKTAEKWREKIHRMLSAGNWKEAAYSIGVLSHYFTDPFMPLHTAQSPRETIVHRPLEWSVCCSYQSIFKIANEDSQLESFSIETTSDWLTDSILRGATMANRHYESLMDDYDMRESSRHPELALGTESRKTLAMIFTWVLTGWGSVIDRIADESPVPLPNSSLAIPTILAGLQIPVKRIVASIDSADQRREVEKILDEFNRTGNVVRNVSLEQQTVQRVRKENPKLRPEPALVQRAVEREQMQQPLVKALDRKPIHPTAIAPERTITPVVKTRETTHLLSETISSVKSSKRTKLSGDSPIVDAPAIGPKTAARLEAIGLVTVHDLLSRDPESISAELQTKWITSRMVAQWQDQAKLSCRIERLSATGSGLLVMAGIQTAEELVKIPPVEVLNRVLAASQTSEGQRLLRDQEPPPMKTIERWIEAARSTRKAA